jgi:hypothetical protein
MSLTTCGVLIYAIVLNHQKKLEALHIWSLFIYSAKTPPRLGHTAPASEVAGGLTLPFFIQLVNDDQIQITVIVMATFLSLAKQTKLSDTLFI